MTGVQTCALPIYSFVIYQGHHGDFGAEHSDVVLPGSTYSEKNATYVNTEGKVQTTFKACNPPGLAKEDWKIIVSIGKKLKKKFEYYSVDDVRKRDRKSTRLNSSHALISYAVFCLKKKKKKN